MQKSNTEHATRAHRRVGASTTLNRRYVRRPQRGTEALEASVKEAAQEEAFEEAKEQIQARQVAQQARASQQVNATQQVKVARQTQVAQAAPVKRSPRITRFNDEIAASFASPQTESFETAIEDVAAEKAAPKKRSIQIKDEADREVEEAAKKAQQEELARQAQIEAQQAQNIQLTRQQIEEQMVQGNALVPVAPVTTHPIQAAAMERMRQQKSTNKRQKMSAKEIKEREIKKALAKSSKSIDKDIAKRERAKKRTKLHFSIARVMLAISCTAAAVMAIVYFVGTNMPDISMRVAAMQTGIRASYPGYVPRGFNMTDLSSEDGRVSMSFQSDENDDAFTMVEENSSWDSSALETNYVKKEYGENYTIVREQGLTIYYSEYKGAAWVNGGVVYKLNFKSGTLTKKQVQSIATSL